MGCPPAAGGDVQLTPIGAGNYHGTPPPEGGGMRAQVDDDVVDSPGGDGHQLGVLGAVDAAQHATVRMRQRHLPGSGSGFRV